jgi:hypothetical protein
MKTFEENLNAWLEGPLDRQGARGFEASLPEISEAELSEAGRPAAERAAEGAYRLAAMTNQEFFNHQLRTQIESEMPAAPRHEFAEPRAAGGRSAALFRPVLRRSRSSLSARSSSFGRTTPAASRPTSRRSSTLA